MATLNIGGKRVKVDDAFLSLSPEQQQATVDEIAGQLDAGPSAAFSDAMQRASDASQSLKGPVPQRQETFGESYPGQALSGVNEGIANLLGAPVDLATHAVNLGIGGANAAFGTDLQPVRSPIGGSEMFNDLMSPAISAPTDDPGKQAVRRVAQEVGAAAIPVMGTVGRVARPLQAIAGETAMALGSGAGAAAAEQIAPDNPWAEMLGQVGGALGVSGASRAAKRAITPFDVSPERAAASDALRREGVELTAGQQTGSKGLQYAESELGGGQIAHLNEQQAEQFTSAALRRAGISADRATPAVMNRAFTDLGQQFDDIASRSSMPLDRQLGSELADALQDYRDLVPDPLRAPVVENAVAGIINAARGGTFVPGTAYQALRSRFDRLARGAATDPQLSEALYGIRNAMDAAVERYLAQASPDTLGAWQQARHDYRNMLVLERASQNGGEAAALGLISPAQLRSAVQNIYGKRSYVRGQDEFSELAQAGQATMTPLPQSGTAPRTAVRNLTAGVPSVLGAGLGAGAGGLPGAIAGAVAGAAVPAVAGRAILSGAGRRYLGNRVIRDRSPAAQGAAPAAGVAAGQNSPPSSLVTWLRRIGYDDLASGVADGRIPAREAYAIAGRRRSGDTLNITVRGGAAAE